MHLRPATVADALTLHGWANDPEARRASGNRPVIDWREHLAWLIDRLAGPGAVILIGESAEGRSVGSIRFETADDWQSATLSYVVAPEARGQGFGRALLIAGVPALRERYPAIRIDAMVLPDNARSVQLFERLGWGKEPTESDRIRFVDLARSVEG